MSTIEPTLTAEDWESIRQDCAGRSADPDLDMAQMALGRHGHAAAIALANAALPDSDPRKITRERIDEVRAIAFVADVVMPGSEKVRAFLDALESYLPPA